MLSLSFQSAGEGGDVNSFLSENKVHNIFIIKHVEEEIVRYPTMATALQLKL